MFEKEFNRVREELFPDSRREKNGVERPGQPGGHHGGANGGGRKAERSARPVAARQETPSRRPPAARTEEPVRDAEVDAEQLELLDEFDEFDGSEGIAGEQPVRPAPESAPRRAKGISVVEPDIDEDASKVREDKKKAPRSPKPAQPSRAPERQNKSWFKFPKLDLDRLLGFFSNDIGIDLGTATTLVFVKGQGVVLCEPSVVVIDRFTHEVLAVGDEAKEMLGRTPGNIIAIRPLKDGVIADFDITEAMLRYFIRKVRRRGMLISPRVVIAVPGGITEVEKRAVMDSAARAGARSPVLLVEEPIAAAIGVGLPIQEPSGNMIVDVGGGTTEIAVISMAGMSYSRSIRVGGDEYDEAIINHLKRNYNLVIGERTAEEIKIQIGSVYPVGEESTMEVTGRDVLAGLPKTITVSSEEIREALAEPTHEILEAIRVTLERTPPELSADLSRKGMILAGGGALLRGLDELIGQDTGLPVHIAEDPLTAVALGTGRYLSDLSLLKRLALNNSGPRQYDYAYT